MTKVDHHRHQAMMTPHHVHKTPTMIKIKEALKIVVTIMIKRATKIKTQKMEIIIKILMIKMRMMYLGHLTQECDKMYKEIISWTAYLVRGNN